jgi:hypothetical protein
MPANLHKFNGYFHIHEHVDKNRNDMHSERCCGWKLQACAADPKYTLLLRLAHRNKRFNRRVEISSSVDYMYLRLCVLNYNTDFHLLHVQVYNCKYKPAVEKLETRNYLSI